MKRLFTGLAILICGYGAVLSLLGSSGARAFFSPDTLEYRSQTEVLCYGNEIPLFRGIYHYHEHEFVAFLVAKGYWQPREVDSPRWLFLFQWNHMWRDGQGTLHRQLFGRKVDWIEWTNRNPEVATQYWPHILDLLREGNEVRAVELLYETR